MSDALIRKLYSERSLVLGRRRSGTAVEGRAQKKGTTNVKLNFKGLRAAIHPFVGEKLTQQDVINRAAKTIRDLRGTRGLRWSSLVNAGIIIDDPQKKIDEAAKNLDSLRGRLAETIQRVGELTKQNDDKDTELRATKDALEAMRKDRDKRIEETHLRCETSSHFITREDKALKRCPQCRLQAFERQRTALRGAIQLVQRAAKRSEVPKEYREALPDVTRGLVQIFGVTDAALVEEQLENDKADKEFGSTNTGSWMTSMHAAGAVAMIGAMAWFSMMKPVTGVVK